MDMFTTRTMMAMVEAGKKTNNTWLRDRYFGYRPTFNTQKIDFDIVGMGGARSLPSSIRRSAAWSLSVKATPRTASKHRNSLRCV